MSSETRKKALLGLLGLLAVVLVWQRIIAPRLGGGDDTATAAQQARSASDVDSLLDGDAPAPRTRRSRATQRRAVTGSEQLVAVRLADLEATGGEYEGGRNPFSFDLAPPPPPPPPPGPTAEELEARRRAQEEAARRAAELAAQRAAEPPRPVPPAIPYTYLGRFGPRDRPIAVLAEGEAIHNVLLGEVLEGKFRLIEIGFESIELEYVDFPDVPAARLPVGTEGT